MKKVLVFLAVFIISKTIFPQIIFGEQQLITNPADGARSVYAIDLDSDGDNDILSASSDDNKIAWYKNNGNGNFGSQRIITTNANIAKSVFAIDLDSYGDNDVLSASEYDNKIAWYENVTSSVFIENLVEENNILIFPNPAKKTVNVSYGYDFILEICDLSGKALITTTKNTINISNLSKGIYIVLIKNKEGILQKTEKLVVD